MAITLEDHGLVGGGFSAGNTIDINKMGLVTSNNEYVVVAKDGVLPNDSNAILATYDDFIIVLYTNGNIAKCKKNNSSDIDYIEEWSVNTDGYPDEIRRFYIDKDFVYIGGVNRLEKISVKDGSYQEILYGTSVEGHNIFFYNDFFFTMSSNLFVTTPPYKLFKISKSGEVVSNITLNLNITGYTYYGMSCFLIKDDVLIISMRKTSSSEVVLVFLDIFTGNEIMRTTDILHSGGSGGFTFDLVNDYVTLIVQSPTNIGTEYVKYNISTENASVVSSNVLFIDYNDGDNTNVFLGGFSKDRSGNILFSEKPSDPNNGKICFIKEDGNVIKGKDRVSNTPYIKNTNRIDDNSEYLSCYASSSFNTFKEIIVNPKIQIS